jgi:dolichol-phosphate mannosyltransferase
MEMDADLSHNPDDAPRLLQSASDADLVIGSRYIQGIRVINWPLRRLLLSIGASYYVKTITGMPFADPTGGFKCFRSEALTHALKDPVHSNGYSFQIELTHRLWRSGWRIAECPIVFTERTQGASKMSKSIIREAVIMVWRLLAQHSFRRKPLPRGLHATH